MGTSHSTSMEFTIKDMSAVSLMAAMLSFPRAQNEDTHTHTHNTPRFRCLSPHHSIVESTRRNEVPPKTRTSARCKRSPVPTNPVPSLHLWLHILFYSVSQTLFLLIHHSVCLECVPAPTSPYQGQWVATTDLTSAPTLVAFL